MAFCRQMQDDVRLEVGQRRLHRRRVGDIRPHKPKARMVLHRHERIEIARIGELIDDKDMMVGGGDGMPHEGGADEPCPTRDQKASSHQRSTYTKELSTCGSASLSLLCPVPPPPMVSIRRAGPQLSGNLVMAAYWGACASVTCARSLRRFVNDRFDRPREARPELAKPLEHGPLTINVDGCANDLGPQ
jgi:hypothetical protein